MSNCINICSHNMIMHIIIVIVVVIRNIVMCMCNIISVWYY